MDVDDVLIDLVGTWMKYYNRDFNDNVTKFDIKEWNIAKAVKPEAKEAIYDYIHDGKIFTQSPLIKGATEGVRLIKEAGYRVVYVTAGDSKNAKEERLKKEGFLTDDRDFVAAKDKTLIRGDYMLDDSMDNIKSFKGKGWLMTRPWNKAYNYPFRVKNWEEAIEKIENGELFR